MFVCTAQLGKHKVYFIVSVSSMYELVRAQLHLLHAQYVDVRAPLDRVRGVDADETLLVRDVAREEEAARGLAERGERRQAVVIGLPHGEFDVLGHLGLLRLELNLGQRPACQLVRDRQRDTQRVLSGSPKG